jgi:uncharacterized protein YjbJ (UPF0337 family)
MSIRCWLANALHNLNKKDGRKNMNREQFEGNWHQLKGKLKEKWGKLTNDDIEIINGEYEQFLGILQQKYGYSKEQAEKETNNWNLQNRKEGHPAERTQNPPKNEHPKGPKEYSSKPEQQKKDKFKHNDQRDKKRKAG